MAAEQFCLKWNNFQTSILTAFESLQATEDLADVTLACEGACVRAHKFILSACSPYFRALFKGNPCSHPIVILKDILYKDMVAVLNFMYHGEVLVSKEQLKTFLQTAEALEVSGLKGSSDDIPKQKNKRISDETEVNTVAKKNKLPRSKNEDKVVQDDCVGLVTEDNIKVEIEEDLAVINANNYEKGGSILEAALEPKECPSILERSLTSQVKSPPTNSQAAEFSSELVKQLHIPRKPPDDDSIPDPLKIEIESDQSNEGSLSNENHSVTARMDVPHHSSQCGNCPHCGKIYSNQSALKYHVRLVHSDLLNLYCCHLCPLTFGFRDSYKKHMIDAHSVRP